MNITLGRGPLALAVWALNQEDPKNADALELLRGLKAIYVRSDEFAADAENVYVCVSIDHDKVNGLAIVASSSRKFTIMNIVGSIDRPKLPSTAGAGVQNPAR